MTDELTETLPSIRPQVTPLTGSSAGSRRTRRSMSGGKIIRRVILYLVLTVLGLLFATPLLWMISASLKPENEVLQTPPTAFGSQVLFSNYVTTWKTIAIYFRNSIYLAMLNVIFLLVFAALAAYAFARIEFRGRSIAFAALLATAMLPSIVYLIPQYIIFRSIGWIDTYNPLWIPRVLTPVFGTFLLRQAFRGIPRELEEASRLDGCSLLGTFWRIMLPQVKPALASVAVLTFMESWNDLFGPLIFLNSNQLQTLPVALALFQGQYFSQTNLEMAAATMTVLPPLVLFLFMQKYFISGIVSSGFR